MTIAPVRPASRQARAWLLGVLAVTVVVLFATLNFAGDAERPRLEPRATEVGTPNAVVEARRLCRIPDEPLQHRSDPLRNDSAGPEAGSQVTAPEPRLRGVVFDADGRPCGGASVAVFPLGAEGPESKALVMQVSQENGRFALKTERLLEEPMLIVAATRGQRPAWTTLSGRDEATEREIELHLEEGFTITGRVTINDQPDVDRTLSLDTAPGVAGLFLFPGLFFHGEDEPVAELFWRQGRPETKHARAVVDAQGNYAMKGLGPGSHVITVGDRDVRGGLVLLDSVTDRDIEAAKGPRMIPIDRYLKYHFSAPDPAADIRRDQASVLLRVSTPGTEALARGRIKVTCCESDDPQSVEVDFATGEFIDCTLFADRRHRIDITTP
ncbi:MAG: hypothetical protein KDB53_12570, partial [Planctomycetes bacterium]|nr:hypothetical protein [Planctomycetota bacterium]